MYPGLLQNLSKAAHLPILKLACRYTLSPAVLKARISKVKLLLRQVKQAKDWMHNPAMVYAGMVHSLVTGYRVFSGDNSYVKIVKDMLDYQLQHGTTPSGWAWANVPYASSNPFEKEYYGATKWEKDGMRGDGLHGIEPDKVGDLGFAYLVFYETTQDTTYLKAAINCADALAKNVKDVGGDLAYFSGVQTKRSPWPFRVNARNG
jgi:rhamnogalacturonyl hydrolase YesR